MGLQAASFNIDVLSVADNGGVGTQNAMAEAVGQFIPAMQTRTPETVDVVIKSVQQQSQPQPREPSYAERLARETLPKNPPTKGGGFER